MRNSGIDVSRYQGNIDWKKVKNSGIKYAILKAGYGREFSQVDANFESNYSGARSVGMPIGVYWYCYATDAADARREAKACINAIKGKYFDYPIYYDIEETDTFRKGKATVSAIARAFCEEMEKAGYYVGIYSMKSALEAYFDDDVKKAYTVWLAHVDVDKSSYKGNYDMWQYSWNGKINGISGDVDCDYCYKDFPAIIRNAGLNGYTKATSAKKEAVKETKGGAKSVKKATENTNIKATYAKKSVTEVAKEVIQGKWGNGNDRKNALSKAGYNYNEVQKKVNDLLGSGDNSTVYTVKSGDTLSDIAIKYNTTVNRIASDNGIANPNRIFVGQKLNINK